MFWFLMNYSVFRLVLRVFFTFIIKCTRTISIKFCTIISPLVLNGYYFPVAHPGNLKPQYFPIHKFLCYIYIIASVKWWTNWKRCKLFETQVPALMITNFPSFPYLKVSQRHYCILTNLRYRFFFSFRCLISWKSFMTVVISLPLYKLYLLCIE